VREGAPKDEWEHGENPGDKDALVGEGEKVAAVTGRECDVKKKRKSSPSEDTGANKKASCPLCMERRGAGRSGRELGGKL